MKGFLNAVTYLALIGVLLFLAGRAVPKSWFPYSRFPFRPWGFERGGAVYQNIGIRKWKSTFPDMSVLLPKWLPSKRMPPAADAAHLELMVQETCIAESVHMLLAVLGFGCVFLWPCAGGWGMAVLYALGNLPYICIQRYNRPKLAVLLRKMREKDRIAARGETERLYEKGYHFKLQHGTRA